MQLSIRSYLTAGIAALGATAIIAAPITPITHDIALSAPSISSVAADVEFTSVLTDLAVAFNFVVNGFTGAAGDVVMGATAVLQDLYSANNASIGYTADILAKILDYGYKAATSPVIGFVNAADVLLPVTFGKAVADVADGFLDAGDILVNDLGGSVVTFAEDTLKVLNYTGTQLVITGLNYPLAAAGAVIAGFQNALVAAAGFDFGTAFTEVVGGFQSAAGILAIAAQGTATVLTSTASTLFNIAKTFAGALVTYPIDAVKEIYGGIKAAFGEFGIPLPFAATKPTAAVTAPAAAAVAPAAAAAGAEATDATGEQAPAPRASKRSHSATRSGSERADAGQRSVAPSTSAVQGQHDSEESSSSAQSNAKQSGTKDGSKRDAGSHRASHRSAA